MTQIKSCKSGTIIEYCLHTCNTSGVKIAYIKRCEAGTTKEHVCHGRDIGSVKII